MKIISQSQHTNDPFWLGKSFKISSGFTFFLSFAWSKTKLAEVYLNPNLARFDKISTN